MSTILEFLNQPIVLTLITITMGSLFINLIAERRAKQDKLRDKAIEFLSEAGSNINRFASTLNKQLRTDGLEVDEAIREGLSRLFSNRMSVQVGSQAYLKNGNFHLQYYKLLDELADVVGHMVAYEKGRDSQELAYEIRGKREHLRDGWPLADEAIPEDTAALEEEFLQWMDMIMCRATDLISSSLKLVIR